jgi:hypothetical protein
MNYGNSNYQNKNTCPHCGNDIGKHAIGVVRSDAATEKLALKLQHELERVLEKALAKGYRFPQGEVVTGAVTAQVGDHTLKAVALSGANAPRLMSALGKKAFPKDIDLLAENVPLSDFRSLVGVDLSGLMLRIDQSRMLLPGAVWSRSTPGLLKPILQPCYPVGTCCAQKLLHHIITKAGDRPIRSINLAEVHWRTNGFEVPNKTGKVLPACHTCLYVLPAMLCNYDENRNKVTYPRAPV